MSGSRQCLGCSGLTGRGIALASIRIGSRADVEAMNRASAAAPFCPVIHRMFPVKEAKGAYRHFEGRGYFEKTVVTHA
jgi:hypothetical protein